VDVPIRALITLHDPDVAVLEGPSASANVPATSPGTQEPVVTASLVSPSLEGPSTASTTAVLPARETHPAEPTVVSSAVSPAEPTAISSDVASSSGDVAPLASTVIVQLSEGTRPQEPIVPSSAITPLSRDRYDLFFLITSDFFRGASLTLFSSRIWIFQSSSRSILPQLGRPYWKPMTLPWT
jgi:hypothetical protein